VKTIVDLKARRQLIFVTHNANIPVLGDADSVLVMSMIHPSKAAAPRSGDVISQKDQILSLLEGGAEAFRLRHDKYGDLLE
jgi:hypothetical protein